MFTLPPKFFGCMAFVHIYDHHHSKLDPKATKCLFLGYPPTQTGYKCYSPITRKFYVNLDVTFFEKQPLYTKNPILGEENLQEWNFWVQEELSHRFEPSIPINQPLPEPSEPLESFEPLRTPSTPTHTQHARETKLHVHSRRKRPQEELEYHTQPEQNQESDLNPKV